MNGGPGLYWRYWSRLCNTKNSGSCLSAVYLHAKLPVTSKAATSSHNPSLASRDYCVLGNGCPRKPHGLSLPGFLTHALFQKGMLQQVGEQRVTPTGSSFSPRLHFKRDVRVLGRERLLQKVWSIFSFHTSPVTSWFISCLPVCFSPPCYLLSHPPDSHHCTTKSFNS